MQRHSFLLYCFLEKRPSTYHNRPCDLLTGIVAGDFCRLGVDPRLRRELRGLAAEQALLFISTGDLGICLLYTSDAADE